MTGSGSSEKPKVRVVKKAHRQKSGTIEVADTNGNVFYKGPCDRCGTMVSQRRKPLADDRLVCKPCFSFDRIAKPSTRVIRKGARAKYITECDLCNQTQATFFLPKSHQDFHCDDCRDALAADRQREAARERAERKRQQEEDTLELVATEALPDEKDAADLTETLAMEPNEAPADDTAMAADGSPAGIDEEEAQEAPPEDAKLFKTRCKRCKTTVTLPFRPERGERIMCRKCFSQDRDRIRRNKEKPATDILFNIVCASCGKRETVDFVPSSLSEAYCKDCFNRRTRRR